MPKALQGNGWAAQVVGSDGQGLGACRWRGRHKVVSGPRWGFARGEGGGGEWSGDVFRRLRWGAKEGISNWDNARFLPWSGEAAGMHGWAKGLGRGAKALFDELLSTSWRSFPDCRSPSYTNRDGVQMTAWPSGGVP